MWYLLEILLFHGVPGNSGFIEWVTWLVIDFRVDVALIIDHTISGVPGNSGFIEWVTRFDFLLRWHLLGILLFHGVPSNSGFREWVTRLFIDIRVEVTIIIDLTIQRCSGLH